MINADAMLKSVNRLERVFGGETRATQSIGEVAEILTRLLQAEKDAARYLWLRESASTEDHGGLAYNFRLVDAISYMPGASPNETMGIDEAIDEAMQCNK